jgi:DNA-binding transcriptional ArsR family regulator
VEQPLLRLGLLGFTDSDRQQVLSMLAQQSAGWPCWELVDFELADAWCIHGGAVECLDGNAVRVNTLLPYSPTISLNPAEITRPIAFTEPMPEGIEAAEIVNFRSPASMRAALQRFEAWLRPLRAQFALGSEMVARERELVKGIYHVLDGHGKLLALVNLVKWTVSLLPTARPVDFEDAGWVLRPTIAADIPRNFITLTVVQLMWTYAVRTAKDALPPRYKTHKIYLRRIPQLPSGWLRDVHLVTLRALSMAPGEFSDIQAATDLSEETLARTLAALYYAGAITTNKAVASHLERPHSPSGDQSSLPPDSNMFAAHSAHSAHGSLSGHGQQQLRTETEDTTPTPLLNSK